jgi:hypothetical protein
MKYFKNCHLARMSDGHYCIIRDLGSVKGGKGLKHHEVVIDFRWRNLARRVFPGIGSGFLGSAASAFRLHAIDMLRARKGSGTDVVGIPLDRGFDHGSEVAVAADKFRRPWR